MERQECVYCGELVSSTNGVNWYDRSDLDFCQTNSHLNHTPSFEYYCFWSDLQLWFIGIEGLPLFSTYYKIASRQDKEVQRVWWCELLDREYERLTRQTRAYDQFPFSTKAWDNLAMLMELGF